MADEPYSALTDGGGILAGDEFGVNRSGTSYKVKSIGVDGWIDDTHETWVYASADSPTFTFTVAADVTTKYAIGQKIKLTQTTVKYFIITAVSAFSGGNTTITIYGGTDYTLANAAISANYHSAAKAPFGFQLNPTKWTEKITDTLDQAQANPTANTIYNLGSLSITIPIGAWYVDFQVLLDFNRSAGALLGKAGLSNANNTFSDAELVSGAWGVDAGTPRNIAQCQRSKELVLTSKTQYYLNGSVNADGLTIDFRGDLATTVMRAICAYL